MVFSDLPLAWPDPPLKPIWPHRGPADSAATAQFLALAGRSIAERCFVDARVIGVFPSPPGFAARAVGGSVRDLWSGRELLVRGDAASAGSQRAARRVGPI